ncbi:MAG: hypothetical protein ACRDH9_04035 [Actinomycetota bacterium]
MLPRKRLLLTMAAAGVLALPAAVIAGLCLGNACREPDRAQGPVPFCSLPAELRTSMERGFRDARSPHVLAVAGKTAVESPTGEWLSIRGVRPPEVPLVFAGSAVRAGEEVPAGTTLDAVAPTLAEMMGLVRPDPRVRSGEAIPNLASSEKPRLAVVVVWKGVTSRGLQKRPQLWPVLRGLIEDGAATMQADPGSLPQDPAAILNTIGTGTLPRDHGITGSLVRNDQGEVVQPWSEGAPFSVVASLGDHLDELTDQVAGVGLIGTDVTDQGLIGGNWYIEHDRDEVFIEPDPEVQAGTTGELMVSSYGGDEVTDLLGVAMAGSIPKLDTALGRILSTAKKVSGDSFVLAVTSTGSDGSDMSGAFPLSEVESEVSTTLGADVIEAATAGGFFLDQDAMTAADLSDDRVVDALRRVKTGSGEPLFADVFPSIAVTFGKYC